MPPFGRFATVVALVAVARVAASQTSAPAGRRRTHVWVIRNGTASTSGSASGK